MGQDHQPGVMGEYPERPESSSSFPRELAQTKTVTTAREVTKMEGNPLKKDKKPVEGTSTVWPAKSIPPRQSPPNHTIALGANSLSIPLTTEPSLASSETIL